MSNYNNMSDYNNYDMITDNVAIGDHTSSYDPFDVVVNLNYPYNNVDHHTIHFDRYDNGKIVIRIGIMDRPDEKMYSLLSVLLPKLLDIYYNSPNRPIKFLFHCYAGISRSSTLAIAFLSAIKNNRPETVFNFAKTKRPIINPNERFASDLVHFFS